MTQEFIPYKLAVKLKKLGFDEPCLFLYNSSDDEPKPFLANPPEPMDWNTLYIEKTNKHLMSAPTYSAVFRWFREKKLSDACVCRYQSRGDGGVYYYYVINHDFGVEETKHYKKGFFTYDEAELACLNKLLKICESKTK